MDFLDLFHALDFYAVLFLGFDEETGVLGGPRRSQEALRSPTKSEDSAVSRNL